MIVVLQNTERINSIIKLVKINKHVIKKTLYRETLLKLLNKMYFSYMFPLQ